MNTEKDMLGQELMEEYEEWLEEQVGGYDD